MIAIFNKDVLDLSVFIPFIGNVDFMTRLIEWNLSHCIFSYVFDEQGGLRRKFLKESHRAVLIQGQVLLIYIYLI